MTSILDVKTTELQSTLSQAFSRYNSSNLSGITAADFENRLRSRIGVVDPTSEGFQEDELDRQRDLSVKFHWGHTHDFGTFQLDGRMGIRHLELMSDFI